MIHILHALMQGNEDIAAQYHSAKELWDTIVAEGDKLSDADLPNMLSASQRRFEALTGSDRFAGKELMGYSLIAYFYSPADGFANISQVLRYYNAIMRSTVSIEVHGCARRAAELGNLAEHANEAGIKIHD